MSCLTSSLLLYELRIFERAGAIFMALVPLIRYSAYAAVFWKELVYCAAIRVHGGREGFGGSSSSSSFFFFLLFFSSLFIEREAQYMLYSFVVIVGSANRKWKWNRSYFTDALWKAAFFDLFEIFLHPGIGKERMALTLRFMYPGDWETKDGLDVKVYFRGGVLLLFRGLAR